MVNDEEGADRAIVPLVRNAGATEILELFWFYGARDFRDIGHKAIYAANSWRTLQTVGWRDDPSFSRDSFDTIYQYSGGIPRKINILCDRLLLMGRLDKKHAFTGKEVAEVINELQQEFAPADLRVSQKGAG